MTEQIFMNQREKIILLKYGSKLEAVCNLNIKNKKHDKWLFLVFSTCTAFLE